ncbi:bifunctional 2-methylcitrate synthase/citrate synthase [bacterium]|nr:bifunctional 2-methylcitrate synthase/citrate synthase [bacterium]
MSQETPEIKKGLVGVVVDETSVSKVMPDINALVYRGYPVQELADKCSFEEVAYLIWNDDLPTSSQLEVFEKQERANRDLSPELWDVISKMPKTAHPMDAVRTGVSFLGLEDERIWDNSPATDQNKALLLMAKIPTITAAFYRHRKGEKPIKPDSSKSFSENFFHMTFGEVPHADVVKAFDASLVLYAEHSFNASTFTARVVASTTSDMYSSITAAIGALKGPLHGGANEQVMHVLQEIGEVSKAKAWLDKALAEKRKIMGFGHRVYRKGDSRAPTMNKYGLKVAAIMGESKWHDISEVLEKEMIEKKGIYPNLDFPAGPAYFLMGIDIDFFTPIFVMSRITGWSAHVMEQTAANRIIRPLSHYTGHPERKFKPIDAR